MNKEAKNSERLWATGERQRARHNCLEQTAFWQEENDVQNKKHGE